MASAALRLVSPTRERRKEARLTPRRKPNESYREREHLSEREIDKVIAAAKKNRWGQRDSTMILVAYRHGLRASEVCDLQWSDVEFESATLHVRRVKNGLSTDQPLLGDELRALRALKRETSSAFVFVSAQGSPFTTSGFAKLVETAGENAGLPFPIHAHMLRHSCGYALANAGYDTRLIQDYLGHREIQHTVRYTQTNKERFRGLWRK
jgi:integrase